MTPELTTLQGTTSAVAPTTVAADAALNVLSFLPAMQAAQQAASPTELSISLKGIKQCYDRDGTSLTVLDGIDLELSGSDITMLLGPSGCGKSTLLRMLGGVRPPGVKTPTTGQVIVNGKPCDGPLDEAITVFQRYSNRPDLTVLENVLLPFTFDLWKKKVSKKESLERAETFLTEVGLWDRRDHRPSQLSGGQQQRVALARSLALKPSILLMDEPFGALDSQTRQSMQQLLIKLHAAHPCLIVFITHDVAEALTVGDRIISLSPPPAKIALDVRITEPKNGKPRPTSWLRSAEGVALEAQLLHALERA